MWNINVRPHGEYFAKDQAVTTSAEPGNQTANNPRRIENAQGGTGIRVCTPVDGSLDVPDGASLTLTVLHAASPGGAFTELGTAVYSAAGQASFAGDEVVAEYILPTIAKPFIKVLLKGSVAPSGSVDVFPFYVSRPGAAR